MAVALLYPHSESDEVGTPRIGKTRYQVIHLAVEPYHFGWSAEELLRQHPNLRPEEVYSALAYAWSFLSPKPQQGLVIRGGCVEPMKRKTC